MNDRQQNTATYPMTFLLVASTDHVTPVTGLGAAPVVTISKSGAAFGAPSGAISEVGNGWYALAGHATDRDTLGEFVLHATGAGADPTDRSYTIVPWNPFDANLALTNLDATISSRNATTPPTVTAIRTEMDGNSAKLANLDAAVSTRSTYAGADTAGTATLLTRIPGTVAAQTGDAYARLGAAGAGLTAIGDARIAHLDADVSSRNATAPPTAVAIRTEMDANSTKLGNLDAAISTRTKPADTQTIGAVTVSDKTGFSLISAYDTAKTAGSQASITALGSPLQASGYTIPPTANENADALLKRDWTAITGEAAHSVLNALRFLRNKWSVAGTSLTVMKEDGTTAWSGTVSTDSSAPPVTGNTPST